MNEFAKEVISRVNSNADNKELRAATQVFNLESLKAGYSYNFSSLGRPIIQYPQDMVAMQELIWEVKPDLIIRRVLHTVVRS